MYVCENPPYFAAPPANWREQPTTDLRRRPPSTAFHRLARLIVDNGGLLRYHGDFDWPGIAMTNALRTRYGAEPWRMNSADYLNGVRADIDHVPLDGKPQDTLWDPKLAETMAREKLAVYEEAVADSLLKNWASAAHRPAEASG
ncbi:DUF2399 domain-containing protein [Streptomyces sp. M10(2022)]